MSVPFHHLHLTDCSQFYIENYIFDFCVACTPWVLQLYLYITCNDHGFNSPISFVVLDCLLLVLALIFWWKRATYKRNLILVFTIRLTFWSNLQYWLFRPDLDLLKRKTINFLICLIYFALQFFLKFTVSISIWESFLLIVHISQCLFLRNIDFFRLQPG